MRARGFRFFEQGFWWKAFICWLYVWNHWKQVPSLCDTGDYVFPSIPYFCWINRILSFSWTLAISGKYGYKALQIDACTCPCGRNAFYSTSLRDYIPHKPNVQYTCFIVKFLAGKHYLVFMFITSCIVIINIILKLTFMHNVVCLWKLNLSDFTGETDWKVLVIDVNDPMAGQMNGKIS